MPIDRYNSAGSGKSLRPRWTIVAVLALALAAASERCVAQQSLGGSNEGGAEQQPATPSGGGNAGAEDKSGSGTAGSGNRPAGRDFRPSERIGIGTAVPLPVDI